MGLLADTLIGCLFLSLPGPPGRKFHNAYFQLYPVDKMNFWCPKTQPDGDIKFLLYRGSIANKPKLLRTGDDAALNGTGMDLGLPTVVYFPPFFEGGDGLSASSIGKAFLTRGRYNFIVVDSKRLNAGPWYPAAVTNTYFVGRQAALFMDYLLLKGLSLEELHLIGLSIGAHAAGVAGHFMKAGKPPWITGLDPASLLFRGKPPELRLDRSDAGMVDVVHTDDVFGMSSAMGHVDFFINAGTSPQPGCEYLEVARKTKRLLFTVFCSHLRSYQLYAESVVRPKAFPGTSCNSMVGLKQGRCLFGPVQYMGLDISRRARGIYYVRTGKLPIDRKGEANELPSKARNRTFTANDT